MLDHLDTLQSDLDSLKDLLSSGQYNLDASQLLGVSPFQGWPDAVRTNSYT